MASVFNISIERAVSDLCTICDECQEAHDPLSQTMHHWGNQVCQQVQQHFKDSQAEITKVALALLRELRTKILIDPITQAPLRDPILERDWTLERTNHTCLRALFQRISPLDQQEMAESPPSHVFAQRMITWAHALSWLENPMTSIEAQPYQKAIVCLTHRPETDQLAFYQWIAQRAIATRELVLAEQAARGELCLIKAHFIKLRDQTRQILVQVQAQRMASEEKLKAELASIKQIHETSLRDLQDQMAWKETISQERLQAVEQEIALAQKTNAQVTGQLRSEVASMHEADLAAISALQTQTAAEQVRASRLENQLTIAERAHSAAVAQLQATQQSVDHLHTMLNATQQTLQSTQSALQVAQLANQQNAAQIQKLNQACHQQNQRNQDLQNQVASLMDESSSSCSIL